MQASGQEQRLKDLSYRLDSAMGRQDVESLLRNEVDGALETVEDKVGEVQHKVDDCKSRLARMPGFEDVDALNENLRKEEEARKDDRSKLIDRLERSESWLHQLNSTTMENIRGTKVNACR